MFLLFGVFYFFLNPQNHHQHKNHKIILVKYNTIPKA